MCAVRVTQTGIGRAALRRLSFLFQDGMVLSATLRGVDAIDLLEPSLARTATVAELRPGLSETGFAHLRIGLRSLAQAGWIEPAPAMTPDAVTLRWTPAGRAAAAHHDSYIALGAYLATFSDTAPAAWSEPWDADRRARFAELADLAAARWAVDADLDPRLAAVTAHLDGALASPALLWLAMTDRLRGAGPALAGDEHGTQIARLLIALGWLAEDGSWTPDGLCGLDFVDHLGLAGSYLPLLARLPALYAGAQTHRRHVQRELNIRASTVAHARYYADADPLVATVFDREPLAGQPRFVLDSGCGDGAWLAHIHAFVRDATLRGRRLDDHPLLMVGADADGEARARARLTLAAAGAEGLVLAGDTGDPTALAEALAAHGLAIGDALHVHAFVDHDRACGAVSGLAAAPAMSSGAYLDDTGRARDAADVEADLVAHLAGWSPHVGRHGLVLLEAHCVAPHVTARHLGALHSLAFDAYHGYSRQYPVERRAFVAALRRAGLRQAATGERRYPTRRPFVAVSVNRVLGAGPGELLPGLDAGGPRADTWRPDPGTELRDGDGLHRLLYDGGDLRHPRLWSSNPTSLIVTQAMEELEALVATRARGDVLRVLDYGTGTGLAATELLKACRERGLEERLQRRGVTLEVHLVDIPGSWFAKGYEILGGCSWTRFHSLIGADGRFRPLGEVTGGLKMDVILSSMVFHLIKPRAFGRVVEGLGELMRPGSRLVWSTPDVGPAGPWAVLFHDPNRALRAHWKALVAGEAQPRSPRQRDAVAIARHQREGAPLIADDRADKRILRDANTATGLGEMLAARFDGTITTEAHEIADRETLDTLLVPSNQGEYLPEIEDTAIREALIEELLTGAVLPVLHAGPAGTALGYNVHWTFGDFRRCDVRADDNPRLSV
jgi:SAM-dependent methyltransferase